jgi:Methyltransferase domain
MARSRALPTTATMRTWARDVRDAVRASHQRRLLRGSLSRLERCIRAGDMPGTLLLERLVRGWGNEAWSADSPLLTAMLEWLPKTSGTIAECGSGLSTLVLGLAARASGRLVISLEHDPEWAVRFERSAPEYLRGAVDLCITPIQSYGDFDWYSLEGVQLPADIGFVVCDGPPGGTRGGRFGLGPILTPCLAPRCIVLLDDTQRTSEHDIMLRWCAEFGAVVLHQGTTYSVLEVGYGAQRSRSAGC